MPASNAKPSKPTEPTLEPELVADLEPDRSKEEKLRGGGGTGGRTTVFSDAAIKRRVSPIKDSLAKLREVRLHA